MDFQLNLVGTYNLFPDLDSNGTMHILCWNIKLQKIDSDNCRAQPTKFLPIFNDESEKGYLRVVQSEKFRVIALSFFFIQIGCFQNDISTGS